MLSIFMNMSLYTKIIQHIILDVWKQSVDVNICIRVLYQIKYEQHSINSFQFFEFEGSLFLVIKRTEQRNNGKRK